MRATYSGKTDVVLELLMVGANCDLQNKVYTVYSTAQMSLHMATNTLTHKDKQVNL